MSYVLDFKNRAVEKQHAPMPKRSVPSREIKTPEPTAFDTLPDSISWEAPEYVYIKKSPDWYWAVGILTIGLFVVALVFNNFLFGIFMLLGGFTIALYGARPPRMVQFMISAEGIRIENRVYPYESLKSFWIFYHPPHIKELSVESEKMLMPQIKIPLGDINPAQVRAYLQQFIPERQQEESLIDTVTRFLGF